MTPDPPDAQRPSAAPDEPGGDATEPARGGWAPPQPPALRPEAAEGAGEDAPKRGATSDWAPPVAPEAERGAPGDDDPAGPTGVAGVASAASADEPPPLGAALGGPLGIAESVLPSAAFVLTYTATGQETEPSVGVAVGLGALFAVARIVRGQTPQFAIAGLAGLALSAYVVSRTGRAEDFFLPGLLANAAYALAYAISIFVRWPLLGVIVSAASQRSMEWRDDPEQVRAYTRASWIWVALFSLRLAVQLPLYLAGAVVALGVARVAMGIPLFVVGIWLSWLLLRRTAALGPRRHA